MRNGATATMRPFIDDPSIPVQVRFYKVSDRNPGLGLPTIFGFDQWDKNGRLEVFPGFEFAYVYDKGLNDNPPNGTGLCGTAQQWLMGCLTTDPVSPIDPMTGLKVCCQGPVKPNVMGLAGGSFKGGYVAGPNGVPI
jgi:hypothetical protein